MSFRGRYDNRDPRGRRVQSVEELRQQARSVSDAQDDASEISYDNGTSGLTATDVQSALDELLAELEAGLKPYVYTQAIGKFGRNDDVDTGSVPEDVWSQGGTWPGPVTAGQVTFVSDNAADDSGGTGAITIEISYVDSSGDAQMESGIAMNGTIGVTSTATDVQWINSMRVLTAGSNTTNVGTITATIGGTTVISITPDEGRSLSTITLIPNAETAGEKPYILGWEVGIARAAGFAICQLTKRVSGGAYQVLRTATPDADGSSDVARPFFVPECLEAGDYVWIRCIEVSNNATRISGSIDIGWL